MNNLIAFNADTQTVSARDLHESLGISKRFSSWFETNSQGFIEGEDFTSVLVGTEVQNNGGIQIRKLQDYNLSVDMAKHICLMSRTDKGKEIRQYLIDLEKAWNSPEQVFARALKMADATIKSLQDKMVEMKPKADYFDALVDRKLNTNVRDASKELGIKEREFVSFLMENGFCFRQSGKLRPYAQFCESGKGYFTLKDYKNSCNGHAGQQMFITPRGKEAFRLLLSEDN